MCALYLDVWWFNITYLFFITDVKIINIHPNILKFNVTRHTFSRLLSDPLSIFMKLQFNIPEIRRSTVANSKCILYFLVLRRSSASQKIHRIFWNPKAEIGLFNPWRWDSLGGPETSVTEYLLCIKLQQELKDFVTEGIFYLLSQQTLHDFVLFFFFTEFEVILFRTCSSDSDRKHAYKILHWFVHWTGFTSKTENN